MFTTKFVTEKGEKELLKFKYKGSDASYLYKYFFSPSAEFLVKHVFPKWLAYDLNVFK